MVYRLNNRNNYPVLNKGKGRENLYPIFTEEYIFIIIIFLSLRENFHRTYDFITLFFSFLRNFYEFGSSINGIFYSVDIYFIAYIGPSFIGKSLFC